MHNKLTIDTIGRRIRMLFYVFGICSSLQVRAYSPACQVADSGIFECFLQEEMPEFLHGSVKVWVQNHLIYPSEAFEANIGGKVMVSFIVGEDSLLYDIKIARSSDTLFNQAALEVIQKMPRWQPGRLRGKPCKVSYIFPVIFKPEEAILNITDEMPVFPEQYAWQGAREKAQAYCTPFIDSPHIHEKSFVSFIIEKDGYVSFPEIAKSSGYPEIDEKALEIVKSMPRWQPGKYKGRPVRIRYIVPVVFSI